MAPEPIEFPDGRASKLVICVSTINRYSHWGTLYSIYQHFSDNEYVRQVMEESGCA